MKRLFTILAIVAVAVSCQATPPAHKPALRLYADLPTNSVPVTGANFYKAHPADTNWISEGSATGTNGQTVSVLFDATYEWHTADSTNFFTLESSDYAPIFTNGITAQPATVTAK